MIFQKLEIISASNCCQILLTDGWKRFDVTMVSDVPTSPDAIDKTVSLRLVVRKYPQGGGQEALGLQHHMCLNARNTGLQQRCRPECASAQSDQHLGYYLSEK